MGTPQDDALAGQPHTAASDSQLQDDNNQEEVQATSIMAAPPVAGESDGHAHDGAMDMQDDNQAMLNRRAEHGEDRPITIECLILPENHTFQVPFELNRLFGEAKERIGELLSVDPANLKLLANETQVIEDNVPIPHIINPSSDVLNIQLEIDYMHPVDDGSVVSQVGGALSTGAIDDLALNRDGQMIEVSVAKDEFRAPEDAMQMSDGNVDGDENDRDQVSIMVSITRDFEQPLAFLGGYRNKNNGSEYYHANTQTDPVKEVVKAPPKYHRDTQTVDVRSIAQQTIREASTQMERKDLFIDKTGDRVVYSRPYFDSEQVETLHEEMAVKIQCATRLYFARKRARRMIEEHSRGARESHDNESREMEELERQEQEDMERRMYPRSKKDFRILLNELNDWIRQETEAIKVDTEMSLEERKFRLTDLLEKETSLLQTIDRLKVRAHRQNKNERLQKTLIEMGKPKIVQLTLEDAVAEVQTPHTIRAKTLADLYNGLRLTTLSQEERIDVVLHAKWTAKEFDCDLTREIVSLIDREIDLLKRRRPTMSLRGLRKRLAELFLEFLETPEFNPEAARYLKVPVSQKVTTLTATRVMWPIDAGAQSLLSARRRDMHAQTTTPT